MPRELSQSVVVVTGASSGIGRAITLAFARAGASVVLTARRVAPLQAAAAECERLGAGALAVPADVCDAAALERVAVSHKAIYSFEPGTLADALVKPAPTSSARRRALGARLKGFA